MTCTHPPKDDGTLCEPDPNACTDDVCQGGNCKHVAYEFDPPCEDEDPPNECTDDVCSGTTCTHPAKDDGTSCTPDTNECTNDVCFGGNCLHVERDEIDPPCNDDGDACTDDICVGTKCTHPDACTGGQICCGDACCAPADCCQDTTCCSPAQDCCTNGVCCDEDCNGCADHGVLTGGTITVGTNPVCVGDAITFTAIDVLDRRGGSRLENCAEVTIPPVPPTYNWVITKPDTTTVTGPGPIATVVADLGGTYSVTFTVTADRDCPPTPITLGPATLNTCQSGSAAASLGETCGLPVTLKEISFENDHTMYEEVGPCDGSKCWGAGPILTAPDWKSVNDPDNPVCYTRSTPMALTVRIEVEGNGGGEATLRVAGPDGLSGEGTFNVPCGTEELSVTLTTSALPGVVKAYTPALLGWSVKGPGDTVFNPIGSSSHRIYVTLGAPTGSLPTNRRMNFVCYAAAQAATPMAAIDGVDPAGIAGGIGIHKELDADPPQDGNTGTIVNDWQLMSSWPFTGECHQQAHLMNLAMQMVGAGVGSEYLTYASGDSNPTGLEFTTAAALGITVDLDGDGTPGETDEVLELVFDFTPPPAPARSWNNFEGSIIATGKYYSVWPSLKADNACQLLLNIDTEVRAKQYWVYRATNGGIIYHYPVQVPFPTCP